MYIHSIFYLCTVCVLELCRCILRCSLAEFIVATALAMATRMAHGMLWQLGMLGVHLGVRRMGLNDFQYNMYIIYLLDRYDYNIIIFTYNAFCEPSA